MSTLNVPVLDRSSRSKWPNLLEYGTDTKVLKYRVPTELRATCDLTNKDAKMQLNWTRVDRLRTKVLLQYGTK